MELTLREYQERAFRTIKFLPEGGLSDNKVIREKRDNAKTPNLTLEYHRKWLEWGKEHPTYMDLCHMLIGQSSELDELEEAINKKDPINVGEELGDIMWYTVNWATLRKLDIVAQLDVGYYNYPQLARAISRFHKLMKKEIAYNKKTDPILERESLQKIVEACYNFEWTFNKPKIHLPTYLFRNIIKLEERYPDFYSDVKAQDENRNLELERKALEGDGI